MTAPRNRTIITIAERALAGRDSLPIHERADLLSGVAYLLRAARAPKDEHASARNAILTAVANEAFLLHEAADQQLQLETLFAEACR